MRTVTNNYILYGGVEEGFKTMGSSKPFILVISSAMLLLGTLCSCQKSKVAESLDDFVEEYNLLSNPSTYQTTNGIQKLFTSHKGKLEKFGTILSPNCKITLVHDGKTSMLTAEEFIKGIEKASFMTLTQQVIINYPKIEKKDDHFFVSMTKGFLSSNEAQVAECELVIEGKEDAFRITEITRRYRSASDAEVQKMQAILSSETYDPKKGLGVRYLGGGYFNSSTSISPDNTKIVFTSLKNESSELYIMNSDGSGSERLTTSPYWEVLPLFTPDGQHILFLSDQESYQGEPYILRIANGEVRRFLPQMRNVRNITYSADGSIMVFTAAHDGVSEIFIRECDSNEIHQLTRTGHEKIAMVFSSDGKNLFFSEQWYEYDKDPPRSVEIFSIRADGNDIRQLTNDRYHKVPVAYTTDKQLFYILRNRDYDNELWIMENDDSTVRHIISAVNGMNCAWLMPDESAILFEDDRSKPYDYDVYSVNSHHPYEVKRITNLSCYISDLSLSKDGRFITLIANTSDSPGRGKGKIILFDFVNGSQQILGNNY